jgi:hypothetical protein
METSAFIRSPVRAIALPDRSARPESCAATARDTVKRRQGIGGVSIQLRHNQKRKRNADVYSGR